MKKLWLVAIVAAGLLLVLPATAQTDNLAIAVAEYDKVIARASGAGWFFIAPAAAKAQIDAIKPFILDVRRADEFAAERIAGAVNIPITELAKRLGELPANKAAPMIVYCKAGIRGSFGMSLVQLADYTNARNVTGGIDAWKAAGLPVVK